MLNRKDWCDCARALREYFSFENKLYGMNVDLSHSAAGKLADKMIMALGNGDYDWAYDPTGDINWLISWASADENDLCFRRLAQTMNGSEVQDIVIGEAEDLYDFIVEMRMENWPIEVSAKWRD